MSNIKEDLLQGKTALGIEFGSTRIKAVLVDSENAPIASGSHEWENSLDQGIWTYSLEAIWNGLQTAYADLAADVKKQYDVTLTTVGAIGFSAMMHGYMAFDQKGELLVPFRTWRNTITGQASEILFKEFNYNIPQRWSIAHLYQAILNGEEHVGSIDYLTTLAGYISWKLTGNRNLGIGDASGMFPIDCSKKDYDQGMVEKFDALVADQKFGWKLRDILPQVLVAGEQAGVLTPEGAALLDTSGSLQAGIPVAPAEGDAGTGMAATNSVKQRTGNVSAGTSVFLMAVLEKDLSRAYPELDMVTTPDGSLVAMVHCNTCTSDLNAWVGLFKEFMQEMGMPVDMNKLYGTLYNKALEGDKDCGGLVAYNYFAGEPISGLEEGRPMFVRTPNAKFSLANFMRTHLYSSVATLKMGMDILTQEEHVTLDCLMGHGGLFKTKGVGQSVMAAAMNVPVTVMETAGEGGAWGMALLASYMINKAEGETLDQYLGEKVFAGQEGETLAPDAADVAGFEKFMASYVPVLAAEKAAVENLKVES
ncbi:MAG: FGGY-family carbohydrate kinase [Lachnospiraceae bacterium]|nr:FGGY-family carbohydrate kinase [Lachnospiraceae bacterium]